MILKNRQKGTSGSKYTQKRHDVFISYSHTDKYAADGVCANLEANGIRCWYAPRDIRPGEDWAGAIMEAIGEASCFVLIFSGSSNRSGQVANEVAAAFNAGCTIIPFKLEEVPMHNRLAYYLNRVHWIDAVDPPLLERIALLYERIADDLKREEGEFKPVPFSGRRRLKKTAVISVGVLLFIVLAGAIVYRFAGGFGTGYTKEESAAIESAVSILTVNLGVFAAQVNAQQEILELAQTNAVLSGDETRQEDLQELIDASLGYLQTYYIQSLDEDDYAVLLAAGLPADEVRSAMVLPIDMQDVMQDSLETISVALCGSAENQKGYYTDYDARSAMAEAYAAYLDAYIEYAFYESIYVLMVLVPEDTSFEVVEDLEIFSSLYRSGVSGGISAASEEDLLQAAANAAESLEKAYTKMQSAGF